MATAELIAQPALRKMDSRIHQCRAFWFAHDPRATMLAMQMGCVSCDTEFLSQSGWVRIDQWSGQQVAQYHVDTEEVSFVAPQQYIKLPCETMLKFSHSRGLDQMLSDEHRVLWFDRFGQSRVNVAADFATEIAPSEARFKASFQYRGGLPLSLSERELRLQIAVMADGSFPKMAPHTTRCIVRLKKPRKIERLRGLLDSQEYHCRETPDGFCVFHFNAPRREKTFGAEWWSASHEQRQIICDEVGYWDGSISDSGSLDYFTRDKASADFVQFCFCSTGRRASLNGYDREGKTDYVVHAVGSGRTGNYVCLAPQNGNVQRVASPDGFKYCFEVPTSFLIFRRNGCVFASGNTGKSKIAVDLVVNQSDDRVLIACPPSVMGVWRREFHKWAATDCGVLVLDGRQTVARKIDLAKNHLAACQSQDRPAIVVTNYEAARTPAFKAWACTIQWSRVIADECHRLKGSSSKQSKALYEIGRRARRRLGLTGTVFPHSPMDAFGQYRFLDTNVFGTSYHRFRSLYAVTGPLGANHIVAYKNQDDLADRIRPITFECRLEDTDIELPEATHIERMVPLSKESGRIYREMEQDMVAEVRGGLISADNALVKLLRLQQITSGYLPLEDESILSLDAPKAGLLAEILEGIDEPAVVFCRFRRDLDTVEQATAVAGKRYGELSGRRKDLTPHATMPEGVDVMGVQLQSGGVGIDLTRACYAIYFNHPWSLGEYDQSLARVHRPGQTRPVIYYQLMTEQTIDEVVWKALASKREVIEQVLTYLRIGGM